MRNLLALPLLLAFGHRAYSSDFLSLRSSCGLDCARSGLIQCSLTQPQCLCNSQSWFNKFSPCCLSNCPGDVGSILQDTEQICGSVTLSIPAPYSSFTSTASQFLQTYTSVATSSGSSPTNTAASTSRDNIATPSSGYFPTATNSNSNSNGSSSSSFPVGAIAGIAIGGAAIIGVSIVVAILLCRKRNSNNNPANGPAVLVTNRPVQQHYPSGVSAAPTYSSTPAPIDPRFSYNQPPNSPLPPGQEYYNQQDPYSGQYSSYGAQQGAYTNPYPSPLQAPQVSPHMFAAEVDGSAQSQPQPKKN